MDNHLFSSQYGFTSSKKSKIQTYKIIQVLLVLILSFGNIANYLFAAISEHDFPVKGNVVDSVSGEGLSFVTNQIENEGVVVQRLASNNSGNFSFALNTPGKYNVLFHSVGYQLNKNDKFPGLTITSNTIVKRNYNSISATDPISFFCLIWENPADIKRSNWYLKAIHQEYTIPDVPVITQSGDTFHSSSPIGNLWFKDGMELSGENQQKLFISRAGIVSIGDLKVVNKCFLLGYQIGASKYIKC